MRFWFSALIIVFLLGCSHPDRPFTNDGPAEGRSNSSQYPVLMIVFNQDIVPMYIYKTLTIEENQNTDGPGSYAESLRLFWNTDHLYDFETSWAKFTPSNYEYTLFVNIDVSTSNHSVLNVADYPVLMCDQIVLENLRINRTEEYTHIQITGKSRSGISDADEIVKSVLDETIHTDFDC